MLSLLTRSLSIFIHDERIVGFYFRNAILLHRERKKETRERPCTCNVAAASSEQKASAAERAGVMMVV